MFLSLSNQILRAGSLFIHFSEVLIESKFDRDSNRCCSGFVLPHLDDVLTNLGNWSKEREGENRRNLIFFVCKNLFCDLHFEFRQSPDLRSNDSSVMNFKCVQLTGHQPVPLVEEATPADYSTVRKELFTVFLASTFFCNSAAQLQHSGRAIYILKAPFSFSRYACFLENTELLFRIQESDLTNGQPRLHILPHFFS